MIERGREMDLAETLRVAIDARSAQGEFGGVGRGVRSLAQSLVAQPELGIEPLLLSAAELPAVCLEAIEEVRLATPWPGNYLSWLMRPVPNWLRSFEGVFHGPFYAVPFRQHAPTVVTLHDLTYETHPQWFTTARRARFRAQARWAARTSQGIVVPSCHVAERVASMYRVPEDKIYVVLNAIDPVFGRHRGGPDHENPYVVALGGAQRRRLDLAVAAWRLARQQGLRAELVVVGPDRGGPDEGIRHVGRIDDESWASLLAGATAFLYPTEYEGYGMPAAEACATGTPVVAAPNGALPEVLGDAAHWAGAMTAASFASALLGAQEAGGASRRQALARAASLPTWDDSAKVLAACYKSAAR